MITEYFEKLLQISPIPEVSDQRGLYSMWNDGGVECEVGEFLYGLVRVVKPKFVLETGTYYGHSAAYMAQGLKDNKRGSLVTMEIDAERIRSSKEMWKKLGVNEYIEANQCSSLAFSTVADFDIIFLDTEPNLRFHEFVKFFPNLNPGGFIFIHDLPRNYCQGNFNADHPEIESWPFGNMPEGMKLLIRDGVVRPFHLPSPRGLVGFYRPQSGDYVVV